jgi:hypothetical protein
MKNEAITSEPVAVSQDAGSINETPIIAVANSQSMVVQQVDGVTVHPIPALDGFGLLIVSLLLGAAAFWIWRRQQ